MTREDIDEGLWRLLVELERSEVADEWGPLPPAGLPSGLPSGDDVAVVRTEGRSEGELERAA